MAGLAMVEETATRVVAMMVEKRILNVLGDECGLWIV